MINKNRILPSAVLVATGIFLSGTGAVHASISASATKSPSVSSLKMDGRVRNSSLKWMTGAGKPLAGCSIGTAWKGDISKECKKNNKVRLANMFCRANGWDSFEDAPKSATKRNGGKKAITWQVDGSQSWTQGKWVESNRSDRLWDYITCKKDIPNSKRITTLTNLKKGGLRLDVCTQNGGSIVNRCSSTSKKRIAQAICKGYGLGGAYKSINGKPFEEQLVALANHANYNTSNGQWGVANGATAYVKKIRCYGVK